MKCFYLCGGCERTVGQATGILAMGSGYNTILTTGGGYRVRTE